MTDTYDTLVGLFEQKRVALRPRALLAEDRFERLCDAAHHYEQTTEQDPTPEQEAKLDRLILLTRRAQKHWEDLRERVEILDRMEHLWADERALGIRGQEPNRYRHPRL